MQPLNHTRSFLAEVKSGAEYKQANPDKDPICNPCCIGVERCTDMINEVEEAQLALESRTNRDWVIATPNAASLAAARQRIRMTGSPIDGAFSYPRAITKYKDRYYLAASSNILMYDEQLDSLGRWGTAGGETATNSNYGGYIGSIDFHTDGKAAVVMNEHHVVRVFSAAGARLFDIGTWDAAGYVDQNKLYSPSHAIWTKDGNLLVASAGGNDTTANGNYGHVTLYNGTTGARIRTILKGDTTSRVPDGCVYTPYHLTKTATRIYVSSYHHAQIGVLDANTLAPIDVISAPTEFTTLKQNLNVWGVAVNEDKQELILANYVSNAITALDLNTYAYKWHLPTAGIGGISSLDPLSRYNPSGVVVMNNGDILVADHSHHRLARVPRFGRLAVNYDCNYGSQYRIESSALPTNSTVVSGLIIRDVPVNQLERVEPFIVPLVGR